MNGKAAARCEPEGSDKELKRLLARLDPDPERAWEIYRELWQKLMMYFGHHGYQLEAEELSDEVMSTIARMPDLDAIRNVAEFAFGVARNVRMRMPRRRRYKVELPDPDGLPASKENPENTLVIRLDRERKLARFRRCWQELSRLEQELLSEYYPDEPGGVEERRQRLAQSLGTNKNNLRIKIFRIKEKLENCFSRRSQE
jgi:DNA-directed RNA polymerase specialized sigma24 family protein